MSKNEEKCRVARSENTEALAFILSTSEKSGEIQRYLKNGTDASVDAFGAKTAGKRFAESPIVRVVADVDVYLNFSTDGTEAATTSHDYLPAKTVEYLGVDAAYKFLNAYIVGTGNIHVREIY